jgi:hypothetical protein
MRLPPAALLLFPSVLALATPPLLPPSNTDSPELQATRQAAEHYNKTGSSENEWRCQWERHVIFDSYSLEGWGWGGDEEELKETIGANSRAVTRWRYEETEDGGFEASVSLFLCFI